MRTPHPHTPFSNPPPHS
ncbi:hypothetical protein QC764_0027950 [Podospora pseudoanserina]|uniref:Uncharacterized protein n=1 Tax=Podospora pseudoanserina TaxID=2609844 RepID=A0ABR0IT35_9PEZI|nr:hypothetical protein QC764_0027950 [Podospora pseudoanserina]